MLVQWYRLREITQLEAEKEKAEHEANVRLHKANEAER